VLKGYRRNLLTGLLPASGPLTLFAEKSLPCSTFGEYVDVYFLCLLLDYRCFVDH